MAELVIKTKATRKKIIPLVMAIANSIIKQLGFTEAVNETVRWDRAHWNISPGGLAKMLVLGTFTDLRIPLSHLEDRLEGIDVEYFLEAEDKSTFVNDSNMGQTLDRIGESDYDGLYEKMALSAVQLYDMPVRKLHSDTTTISFYGEYDIENLELSDEEKEAMLHIEKGYNKDGRRGSKQIVVGQIVNELGIPLVSKALNGATSDIDWNREALAYAAKIVEAGFTDGIYVADCKLVVEEHITSMNDQEKRIQFVSQCPANFYDKLKHRMIKQAYQDDKWNIIGSVSEGKNATQYKGVSIIQEVCGTAMRLLVLESESLQQKAKKELSKKEAELADAVKALEKAQWKCLPDAEAARKRFLSMKFQQLFDCDVDIEKRVEEKWPSGRRGANTKPKLSETYHLHVSKATISESARQDFLRLQSCLVLISNVIDSVSDKELLQIYKGQQVVENSFRALKSPQVAPVIYLKNQSRIQALNMLLTFSLLLRALIQYRLREGLKAFDKSNPDVTIHAGWGGRPLKAPTFKLLYEHSVNCYFERESRGNYSFEWPSIVTELRVVPLLSLMNLSLDVLLE